MRSKPSLILAAQSGDRLATLQALSLRLAESIMSAEGAALASLAGRLSDVANQIDAITTGTTEPSALERIRAQHAERRAAQSQGHTNGAPAKKRTRTPQRKPTA